MKAITLTLPWPPSINSMYAQGIIGAKRNLEEPFVEVLRRLAEDKDAATIGDVLDFERLHGKDLRALVKQAFGSPRASMFLSDAGKAYREVAATAIRGQRIPKNSLHGRLAVLALAHPPDARTRDLDNLWKSVLDVLKHNQIITDDGHIDDLHVKRSHQVGDGRFIVTISEIEAAFDSRQQGFEMLDIRQGPLAGETVLLEKNPPF